MKCADCGKNWIPPTKVVKIGDKYYCEKCAWKHMNSSQRAVDYNRKRYQKRYSNRWKLR